MKSVNQIQEEEYLNWHILNFLVDMGKISSADSAQSRLMLKHSKELEILKADIFTLLKETVKESFRDHDSSLGLDKE